MGRIQQIGLALLFLLGNSGCSTFQRDWRAAGKTQPAANDIEGRWEGTWSSRTNGHHGRLRCLISKETDIQYLARFHANYRKILSFSYSAALTVHRVDGVYHFHGDADLGRMAGGLYHYEGQASATNFFSTYQAKGDGGVFQMTRPE
jgi:hypothetical protein